MFCDTVKRVVNRANIFEDLDGILKGVMERVKEVMSGWDDRGEEGKEEEREKTRYTLANSNAHFDSRPQIIIPTQDIKEIIELLDQFKERLESEDLELKMKKEAMMEVLQFIKPVKTYKDIYEDNEKRKAGKIGQKSEDDRKERTRKTENGSRSEDRRERESKDKEKGDSGNNWTLGVFTSVINNCRKIVEFGPGMVKIGRNALNLASEAYGLWKVIRGEGEGGGGGGGED